uniref:Uncharacterized protein n=1 Tax=Arundo donax TaxID=35708 RepID=A0A0A9BBA5_ARUDO
MKLHHRCTFKYDPKSLGFSPIKPVGSSPSISNNCHIQS